MTLDKWITYLFDRPVTESPRWLELDDDFGGESAETVLGYMTQLFLEADTILAPFSDAQAAQGLFALMPDGVEHPLLDQTVPLRTRLECIAAMAVLFERFFAACCSPHLSHLDTLKTPAHVSPLNGVCYIWWDRLPLHGITRNRPDNPDGPELDRDFFGHPALPGDRLCGVPGKRPSRPDGVVAVLL